MSIATLSNIKDRIKTATKDSRICLYAIRSFNRFNVDAIFHDTIAGRKRARLDSDFIGCFYGIDGAREASKILRNMADNLKLN